MTDGPIVMSFDIILRLDVYNTKATVHCTSLSREAFYHVMIQHENIYTANPFPVMKTEFSL